MSPISELVEVLKAILVGALAGYFGRLLWELFHNPDFHWPWSKGKTDGGKNR